MKASCSGVILAGGLNSRFGGRPKGLLTVGGRRILDAIRDVVVDLFEDILLVTNDPHLYLEWDLAMVTDLYPVRCSLAGIHTGLFFSRTPHVFVTACDTPFLKKAMVETVLSHVTQGVDVVLPSTGKGLEPLCAVYSQRCTEIIDRQLDLGRYKTQAFFDKVHVHRIPESTIRRADPDLMSFFNVNTPEDLEAAAAACTVPASHEPAAWAATEK